MTVNWITIRVRDFEAAKRFYKGFLGLPLLQEFSPSPSMQLAFFGVAGETQIELIYDSTLALPPAAPSSISIGITPPDYDALLASARKAGVLTREPAIIGGHMECFFVADPDGTGIQIIKALA
jgi:lactoylglutathione lyase